MGQSVPTCCCYNRDATDDITGLTPRVIQGRGVTPRRSTPRSSLIPVSEIADGSAAVDVREDTADEEYGSLIAPVEQPSVGSRLHWEGTCKRCCFFAKDRCNNGADCEFCHYEHEKRRRIKRKRKNKSAVKDGETGDPTPTTTADDGEQSMSEIDDDEDNTRMPNGVDTFNQYSVPLTPDSDAGFGKYSLTQDPAADRRKGTEYVCGRNRFGNLLRPDAGEFAPSSIMHVTNQAQQREPTIGRDVSVWWTDQSYARSEHRPPIVFQNAEEPYHSGSWQFVGTVSPVYAASTLSTGMSCFNGQDVNQQCWSSVEQAGRTVYENGGVWVVDQPVQQPPWYYASSSNSLPCETTALSYDASMRPAFVNACAQQDPTSLPPGVEIAIDKEPAPMVAWVLLPTEERFDQKPLEQQRYPGGRVGGA